MGTVDLPHHSRKTRPFTVLKCRSNLVQSRPAAASRRFAGFFLGLQHSTSPAQRKQPESKREDGVGKRENLLLTLLQKVHIEYP